MKRAGVAWMAIVASLFAATLDAQRLAPAVLTSSTTSAVLQRPLPSLTDLPKGKDYTLEGAAIGGLALGAFGAYFGAGMCGMSDEVGKDCTVATLTGFLAGASVGATLGGIIGSVKKKGPLTPSVQGRADSALFPTAQTRGANGTALGAVMVGGTVAILTTLGCSLDRSGEQENCALEAVKHGAVGAVAGGLAGALIGGLFAGDPRSR